MCVERRLKLSTKKVGMLVRQTTITCNYGLISNCQADGIRPSDVTHSLQALQTP